MKVKLTYHYYPHDKEQFAAVLTIPMESGSKEIACSHSITGYSAVSYLDARNQAVDSFFRWRERPADMELDLK